MEGPSSREIREYALKEHGINIWFIMDLNETLKEEGTMKGSRDDVLRVVELMSTTEKETKRTLEKHIMEIKEEKRKRDRKTEERS